MIQAWHFAPERDGVPVMRDGQLITAGAVYEVEPPLMFCLHGLHGSERGVDALAYAHGLWLSRVELDGQIVRRRDGLCATCRRHLWVVNARRPVAGWAAWCARRVLHLAPEPYASVVSDGLTLTEEWASGGSVSAEMLRRASIAVGAAISHASHTLQGMYALRAASAALEVAAGTVPALSAQGCAFLAAETFGLCVRGAIERAAQGDELERRLVALAPARWT